jgi:hypothetical protein
MLLILCATNCYMLSLTTYNDIRLFHGGEKIVRMEETAPFFIDVLPPAHIFLIHAPEIPRRQGFLGRSITQ